MDFFEDYAIGGKQRFLRNFQPPYFWLIVTFYITSVIVYFINFKIVCPALLPKNKIVQFCFAVLVLIGLFAGIRFLIQEVVLYKLTGYHNYFEESKRLTYYLVDNSYYAIKPILYSTVIYLIIEFIKSKERVFDMQLAHSRAELDLLKSQISPHFLFNTLNAFYVELIEDKPDTARDIHKLSELLRYVTYESKQDFILLQKEVDFLEDYIYFFNKRFEKELAVNFQVEGDIEDQKIPSLVLIHFVENLFKHGVVNDKKHPADIKIRIEDGFVTLTTRNKFIASEKYMESGIGMENVKRRLTVAFGLDHELKYTADTTYFSTYLKIPV